VHVPLLHAPELMFGSSVQSLPQPPQWALSMLVSTHLPSHTISPAGHSHAPPLHVAPIGHSVPQPPQCDVLVLVSTHAPSQNVSLLEQSHDEPVHTPPEHSQPLGQMLPHAPQLRLSVPSSASQPVAGSPSQSAKPLAHTEMQLPSSQATLVTLAPPVGHACPQPPQFCSSFEVSEQPVPQHVVPTQASPPAAAQLHAPSTQVSPSPHALPQAPQFDVSSLTSCSQPSLGSSLQSPKPVAQTHAPPLQT